METEPWIDAAVEQLKCLGTHFERGLSDTEIADLEQHYRFVFPPDLRAFLQAAVPVSDRFPNWRDASTIHKRFRWPYEGICFDIEHNGFWVSVWGDRPGTLTEAFLVAEAQIATAPRLVPIYAHRYLPDEPCLPGNPMFSVYQTDIIFYGYDLPAFFEAEFHISLPHIAPAEPRQIRFWSDLTQ